MIEPAQTCVTEIYAFITSISANFVLNRGMKENLDISNQTLSKYVSIWEKMSEVNCAFDRNYTIFDKHMK